MKYSMKLRLIVSYVALSLFLICSLLIVSNHMFQKHFESYIKGVQEQKNASIATQVLDEFITHGQPSGEFLHALGQRALDDGIIFMVSDKFGGELFCMSNAANTESETMLDAMKETMSNRFPGWQGEYQEVLYGLAKNGVNYGNVTLGFYGPYYYTSQDIHFIDLLNRIIQYIAVAFSLIAAAIGYYMATRIAKPVREVTKKAEQIELGNFSQRIDTVTNTAELDSLIASVNRLASTLEAEQIAKKRMANDYAHEFKTPLTTLQSNLEGMIDGILECSPQRLESCRVEILRLSRMVSEIDKIATLEKTPRTVQKEPFDCKRLIEQLIVNFDQERKAKQINLHATLAPVELVGDRDKISQVFINLLSNAIKYTDPEGSIWITLAEENQHIHLSVRDSGMGIGAEDVPYIFDNLYRTDKSRARQTGGSGVGLSVVKAIVAAHGGTVSVTSTPGQGSEFTVSLPKNF